MKLIDLASYHITIETNCLLCEPFDIAYSCKKKGGGLGEKENQNVFGMLFAQSPTELDRRRTVNLFAEREKENLLFKLMVTNNCR